MAVEEEEAQWSVAWRYEISNGSIVISLKHQSVLEASLSFCDKIWKVSENDNKLQASVCSEENVCGLEITEILTWYLCWPVTLAASVCENEKQSPTS